MAAASSRSSSSASGGVDSNHEWHEQSQLLSIAVFAHKGGVQKTTTSVQLSAACAKMGLKTCYVDFDPQGNGTGFFTEKKDCISVTGEEENDRVAAARRAADDLRDLSRAGGGASARREPEVELSRYHVALDSEGGAMHSSAWDHSAFTVPGLKEKSNPCNVLSCFKRVFTDGRSLKALDDSDTPLITKVPLRENLYFISGSRFYKKLYEWEMSQALRDGEDLGKNTQNRTDCQNEVRKRGIIAKMDRMLSDLGFEVVIKDLQPSDSAINEIICLSSNYIIPPMHLDSYSVDGMHGLLTDILPSWFARHKKFVKKQDRLFLIVDDDGEKWLSDDDCEYFLSRDPPWIFPLLANKVGIQGALHKCLSHPDADYYQTTQAMLHRLGQKHEQATGEPDDEKLVFGHSNLRAVGKVHRQHGR